ncbi:MAG: PAS domain S-box protein, partial [Myxococcaceae bacterium]
MNPLGVPGPGEPQVRGEAKLLLSFLWIQAIGFLVYFGVSAWIAPAAWVRYGTQTAFGWGVILALAWAVRRGHVVLASACYLACGWLLLTLSAVTGGGLSGSAPIGLLVLIVAAGLLLGTRATVLTAAACVAGALGLAVASIRGALPPPSIHNSSLATFADFTVYAGLTVAFQVLAARNLRASQHRYRSLVDRARDVIFIVNREGNITSLNPAFEALTGLPAPHWVGRPFVSLVAGEAPEETWARLQAASGPAFELPVRAASGERVLEVAVAMTTD